MNIDEPQNVTFTASIIEKLFSSIVRWNFPISMMRFII